MCEAPQLDYQISSEEGFEKSFVVQVAGDHTVGNRIFVMQMGYGVWGSDGAERLGRPKAQSRSLQLASATGDRRWAGQTRRCACRMIRVVRASKIDPRFFAEPHCRIESKEVHERSH